MQPDMILEMTGITKVFPGVRALDDVRLSVRRGTVHALMGENGAGKSTLMNILIGTYAPDGGEVFFNGEKISVFSVSHALASGIAMIHQEMAAVTPITVAENLFLGREPRRKHTPFVDRGEMIARAEALFRKLEIPLNPRARVGALSIAQMQLLEIAKAISYETDLLIMDEPTSAITENEVAHLFRIIRMLKGNGVSVIYITHKIDEVFAVCDEATVLRDGALVGTDLVSRLGKDQLISMMVGREMRALFPKEETDIGGVVLSVRNLTRKGEFRDISFDLRQGEILGVAGLMGAGRTEIMETIFGIRRPDAGEVFVNGRHARIGSPRDAIAHRIAMLTEDRKLTGLFLVLSVLENLVMASVRGIFLKTRELARICAQQIRALNIRTPSRFQAVRNLSGGNQQKVFLSRWLLTEPQIMILDEPTRGVDVGAKAEIHRIMSNLAGQGKSIIMISSELPEILAMSDRILVIHEGTVAGVFERAEATQEKILACAAGN